MEGMNCTVESEDGYVAKRCSYWMEGVLMTIVGSLGILGNLMSIYIFSHKKMSTCFTNLLIFLATFDIIFIVFSIFDYSFARVFSWPWEEHSLYWVYLIPKFIYPLNNISFCCSTFLTVFIAGERYFAVCKPTEYRNISLTKSVGIRVSCYVVPVVMFSICLNLPKFFETEFVYNNETIAGGEEIVGFKVTDLKLDVNYLTYYNILTRLMLTGIIPFGCLTFFNTKIYMGIRAHHNSRNLIISAHTAENSNKRHPNMRLEMNLAVVLVCIVVVLLVCHMPRLMLNVLEFVFISENKECFTSMPSWFFCLQGFSHLLLIFNSSSNFIIYCFLNNDFKDTLAIMLRKLSKIERIRYQRNATTIELAQLEPMKRNRVDLDPRGPLI